MNLHRRGRRVALYVLLFSCPTLAALRDDLSAHEDEIRAAKDLVERQNHGRQIIFQLSEHAIQDLLIEHLREDPSALVQDADESTRTTMGIDYHTWLSNFSLSVRDDNVLAVDAQISGRIWAGEAHPDITCAFGLSDEDQHIRILLNMSLATDACGVPERIDVEPVVDLVDLDLSSCSATFTSQEVAFENKFSQSLAARLDTFPLPLEDLSTFVTEESFTCSNSDVTLPAMRPFNANMRTLTAPLDDEGLVAEPVVMIGIDMLGETATYPSAGPDCDEDGAPTDPVSCDDVGSSGTAPGLPVCYGDLSASGDYTLFQTDAFYTYNQSLIAPDHDMVVSVSTRLLRRFYEDLFWLYNNGGETVRQTWEKTLDDVRDKRGRLVSHEEYSRWEGFTTKEAIADPDDTTDQCDGEPEGAWVLDADERTPWLVSHAGLHHRIWWSDTYVSFDAAMRFFIDNSDPVVPTLRSDLVVTTHNDSGCAAKCDGSDDETDAKLEEMRKQLRSASTRFFDLRWNGDGYEVSFDQMQSYAATVALSGRLSHLLTDDDELDLDEVEVDAGLPSPAIKPPVGAIVAFNIDDPADHLLTQAYDPVQGMCPPGYEVRWFSISPSVGSITPSFCEAVDPDGAADVHTLPPYAWCGMDLIPNQRVEECDGLDNDGDRLIDEDFVDANADGVADCYAAGDTTQEFVSTCGGLEPREGCPDGFQQYGIWLDWFERRCLSGAGASDCENRIEDAEFVTCIADGSEYTADMADWLPPGLVIGGRMNGAAMELEGFTSCPEGTEEVSQSASHISGVSYKTCVGTGWWPDSDGDGAPDLEEADEGTDELTRSTDGDPLPDGFELHSDLGLDPLENDSDGDRLTDLAEILVYGTDPVQVDSDGDGLTDGYEVWVMCYGTVADDPTVADTDIDGVPDGEEDVLVLVALYDDWFYE